MDKDNCKFGLFMGEDVICLRKWYNSDEIVISNEEQQDIVDYIITYITLTDDKTKKYQTGKRFTHPLTIMFKYPEQSFIHNVDVSVNRYKIDIRKLLPDIHKMMRLTNHTKRKNGQKETK